MAHHVNWQVSAGDFWQMNGRAALLRRASAVLQFLNPCECVFGVWCRSLANEANSI